MATRLGVARFGFTRFDGQLRIPYDRPLGAILKNTILAGACLSVAVLRLFFLASLIVITALADGASAWLYSSDLVRWRFADGGNGHLYQVVHNCSSAPPTICLSDSIEWETANEIALESGGHLATVTAEAEDLFLQQLVDDFPIRTRVVNGMPSVTPGLAWWLGGIQAAGTADPAANWSWVTGEPFEYTNWAEGEPNDHAVAEDRLDLWRFNSTLFWNDESSVSPFVHSFVIELPVIPEPASGGLALVAMFGFSCFRWRAQREF